MGELSLIQSFKLSGLSFLEKKHLNNETKLGCQVVNDISILFLVSLPDHNLLIVVGFIGNIKGQFEFRLQSL